MTDFVQLAETKAGTVHILDGEKTRCGLPEDRVNTREQIPEDRFAGCDRCDPEVETARRRGDGGGVYRQGSIEKKLDDLDRADRIEINGWTVKRDDTLVLNEDDPYDTATKRRWKLRKQVEEWHIKGRMFCEIDRCAEFLRSEANADG